MEGSYDVEPLLTIDGQCVFDSTKITDQLTIFSCIFTADIKSSRNESSIILEKTRREKKIRLEAFFNVIEIEISITFV